MSFVGRWDSWLQTPTPNLEEWGSCLW